MGSSYQRYDTQKPGEDGIIHDEITAIDFRVYSSEELKKLSVCHVTCPKSFDYLHHPIPSKTISTFCRNVVKFITQKG
jgi:hypothetical protein